MTVLTIFNRKLALIWNGVSIRKVQNQPKHSKLTKMVWYLNWYDLGGSLYRLGHQNDIFWMYRPICYEINFLDHNTWKLITTIPLALPAPLKNSQRSFVHLMTCPAQVISLHWWFSLLWHHPWQHDTTCHTLIKPRQPLDLTQTGLETNPTPRFDQTCCKNFFIIKVVPFLPRLCNCYYYVSKLKVLSLQSTIV